ncbi:VTC domain-containing protein [Pilobolus umbonatus]|nr:VTC domain-containing protein [Pilobolus umbonatus]
MKFGDHLQGKIYEPWRSSYIQYTSLKTDLKTKPNWTDTDEQDFIERLQDELIKVYQFIDRGWRELDHRVEENAIALKKRCQYERLADSLTEILFDMNDLTRFHQLNITGFEKIIKKHDKHTPHHIKTLFQSSLWKQWPLDKMSLRFDLLVVRISELHDICHLKGRPRVCQDYNQGGDQTAFERATAKYWIHPDNITEVKSIILFHLPVHMFNPKTKYDESDMAVSSVYFDNDNFDLYSDRLHRLEGAESIRLRWYSHLNHKNDSVFVERKTHKAAWLNGKSVKDRFRLKDSQVDSFLTGTYTADQLASDLRAKQQVADENHFVASGVQKSVDCCGLRPTCRVFYNRTAFQLPGDQRLRISLDANLTFIKEENRPISQTEPSALHWKREDVGIDYPFRSLPESEVSRFPYAILETKLQNHLGQECPTWLRHLLDSHLVHEVPRFSKYIHGASVLFSDRVSVPPYWLTEFNKDIRRSPSVNIGLSRSMSFKPLVNGHHRQSLVIDTATKFNRSKSLGDMGLLIPRKRDDMSIDFKKEERQSPFGRIWKAETPASAFFKNKENVLPKMKDQVKKVEPKTFFANERTFISWLQFCALLLTVALNLLNNGDRISRIIGAIFIILASLLSFYALGRFQLRSWQLRTNKHIIRYDDVYGPTALCILLVSALLINFYLRADTLSSSYVPLS